jgi:hypothetical protein
MKLIDVDSKATLEHFLTLKKRLNLYSFYGNVMKKSVVSRMSLQLIKNRQENFCNRKCYIPTAKDDNSNYER